MTKPQDTPSGATAPLTSYGSKLFDVLIEGSRAKLTQTLPYREAVQIRIRLHQLRHRMHKERHELYPIAAKAKISIRWDEAAIPTRKGYRNSKTPLNLDAPVLLTIEPRDSEFDTTLESMLEASGAKRTVAPPATHTEPITTAPPTIDAILKDWQK